LLLVKRVLGPELSQHLLFFLLGQQGGV
jgi:hypothetical protein